MATLNNRIILLSSGVDGNDEAELKDNIMVGEMAVNTNNGRLFVGADPGQTTAHSTVVDTEAAILGLTLSTASTSQSLGTGDSPSFEDTLTIKDTTTSSTTTGGKLILEADDGALMADTHRLGVIEFKGAEATGGASQVVGARIEAVADTLWTASENGTSLKFFTTDADAAQGVALTLDSDQKATFAGAVAVSGNLTVSGTTTTVDSTTITTGDAMFSMGTGQTATDADALDFGFYGTYDESDVQKYKGIYVDASDSDTFKFFTGTQTQPTTVVDPTATGYALAPVDMAALGATTGTFSGDVSTAALTVAGHVLPGTDDSYDLGSASAAFQDLFLEGDISLTDAGTISSGGALTITSAGAATWSTSSGALTIDSAAALVIDTDGTDNISLGTEAAAKTITIGADESTKVDVNALAIELDSAATIVMDSVTTTDIDAAGILSLNSSAAAINVGNDAVAQAINVGTGAAARTITVGNVTGATAVNLNAGTGGMALASTGAGDITINSDDTMLLDADGVLELNSSAGVIGIGSDNVDYGVNIATAGTRTLAVGINDGTDLTTINIKGNTNFGVDDTGGDVKMFGAAAGAFTLWDESANKLIVQGASAAGPGHLALTTGELTVIDGDVLGRIDFSAPLESSGTDAILVGASIWAEADDTFDTDNNDTDLVFATGNTAAAAERMRIDGAGLVTIGGGLTVSGTLTATVANATNAANVYITEDNTGDTSCSIIFTQDAGGANRPLYEDSGLLYNNTTNYITCGGLTGATITGGTF